jgi:type IV secretion system protein VirB10
MIEPHENGAVDRGDFALQKRKGVSDKQRRIIVVLGVGIPIVLGIIGLIIWMAINAIQAGSQDIDISQVKPDPALAVKPTLDDDMAAFQKQIAEKEAKAAEKTTQAQESPSTNLPDNKPEDKGRGQNSGATDTHSDAKLRRLSGGVLAVLSDQNAGNASRGGSGDSSRTDYPISENEEKIRALANSDPQSLVSQYADAGQGASGGSFEDKLAGTEFAPARAYLVPPRKYLLRHNTYARCVLYTEIVTDHPGLIDCRLTNPLYSADGTVVLAEAGDILTGEQRVEVKPGQSRVFTSWTELETSSGVRARLNSLGAGPLGASGTDAWIDNHYAKRFGGAVMLSFIQDAFQTMSNATAKNNSTYSFDNSSSNAEDMASKALENSINIPPTAFIPPGTVLTVIVARDIDFSSVFTTRSQTN